MGRYDVTGLIRAGGMGTVHDAVDREHGTRVALKTLNHLSPSSLLRFKGEFRSVADLSHPNLVAVYELSCHDDLWFFTMERIDGVGFIDWLRGASESETATIDDAARLHAPTVRGQSDPHVSRPRGRDATPTPVPSVPALRDAFAQLVRGVRALHAAGILHLDLKPSNVLVDRAGRVVVVDFGLAREIDRTGGGAGDPIDADTARRSGSTEPSSISGTPAWMAPEQYAGVGIGAPSDWYAVGLMLYLALTGVAAFPPASIPVLWYAKRNFLPTPPDRLLADLPPDLCALSLALMDPDPARRPTGRSLASLTSGGVVEDRVERRTRQELVGRETERARASDALSRVLAGGSAVVHFVGPSGVGKSTLLEALLDDARRDALVLRGRCYERESVPYKAFDRMLDGLAPLLAESGSERLVSDLPVWIGELSRVFPVLASVPAISARLADEAPISSTVPVIEVRRRAVEALRELFTSIAAHRPLVLAIDDLHWADADSVALLVKLVEPPAPKGLLIAASFRAVEAASSPLLPYLDALRKVDASAPMDLAWIEVGPLAQADAERLAAATLATLGVISDGLAAAIAREAGGVPFYVEELAHYAAHQRAAGADASTTGVALESVLARRVQSLASAERAIVEALAVAGNSVPLAVAFAAAGIEGEGVLRALWSLRSGHFVRGTGANADDRVELHHDGMRESVLRSSSPERVDDLHLALGRAFAERIAREDASTGAFLFEAVRHLRSVHHRLVGAERMKTAALDQIAGRRARRAAAFPLAFACFHAGTELAGEAAWDADYDLALGLHGGAAEMAYLSAAWGALDAHVAQVKSHGRTILDQLVAWEVEIDACIARSEYSAAVDVGLQALRLLDVDLPANPGEAEVGIELTRAMEALARVGPSALATLPNATDPTVVAAMRIESRLASAAYFARPMLLPLLASRLVATSVDFGLSPATPYALSVYGIVLNSLGMLPEAHTWGKVALDLIGRFDDRSLEARTRHVVHDLVGTWIVPLASTLDDLRSVVAIGRRTGDLEFAAYAAHAYVHNAFYASRPIEPLLDEALVLGAFMRGHEQVNALHVHAPFEQLLRCFSGRAADPASLNGDGFDEVTSVEAARAAGSRSAQCIVELLMGIARYHFGAVTDASACFERARPFLDGVVSTWHTPMLHQYAALAIHGLPGAERRVLRDAADAGLAALRALAVHGASNFAHRVSLVEAASARADGDTRLALERCEHAIAGATDGGWLADVAIAHTIASLCHRARGDAGAAERSSQAARDAYALWGAVAPKHGLDVSLGQ